MSFADTVQKIGPTPPQMGSLIGKPFINGTVVLPESAFLPGSGVKKNAFIGEPVEFGRPKSAAISARRVILQVNTRPATSDANANVVGMAKDDPRAVKNPPLDRIASNASTTHSSPLSDSPAHQRVGSMASTNSSPSHTVVNASPINLDRKLEKDERIQIVPLPPKEALPFIPPLDISCEVFRNQIIDRDAFEKIRSMYPNLTEVGFINCIFAKNSLDNLQFANLTSLDLSGSEPVKKVPKEKRAAPKQLASPKVQKANAQANAQDDQVKRYPWITVQLRTLCLRHWSDLQRIVDQRLALKDLTSFDIADSGITDDQFGALAPAFEKLTALNLTGCQFLTMRGVWKIVQIPTLQTLFIGRLDLGRGHSELGDNFFGFCNAFAEKQQKPGLQELSMSASILTKKHIEGIAQISTLKKVHLVCSRYFDQHMQTDWDARLKPLAALPNLEELDCTEVSASLKEPVHPCERIRDEILTVKPDTRIRIQDQYIQLNKTKLRKIVREKIDDILPIVQAVLPNITTTDILKRYVQDDNRAEELVKLLSRYAQMSNEFEKQAENLLVAVSDNTKVAFVCQLAEKAIPEDVRMYEYVHEYVPATNPVAITMQYLYPAASFGSLEMYCSNSKNAVPVLEAIYNYYHPRQVIPMDVQSLQKLVLAKEQAGKVLKVVYGDTVFQGIVKKEDDKQIEILTNGMAHLSLQPTMSPVLSRQPTTHALSNTSGAPANGDISHQPNNSVDDGKEGHNAVPPAPPVSTGFMQKLCDAVSSCWSCFKVECVDPCKEGCNSCGLECREMCVLSRQCCRDCRQMSCAQRCHALCKCINSLK